MSTPSEFGYQPFVEKIGRTLGCENFALDVRAAWRAQEGEDHRVAIRTELARLLNDPGLLDLTRLPAPTEKSLSISHCPIAGGYALCASPHVIGLDLEAASRIRPAVVARVSRPEELEASPSASILWAAKEATFKALRGANQPSVISELRIHAWSSIPSLPLSNASPQAWTYESRLTHQNHKVSGKGLIFQLGDLIYGIFAALGST